jgi:hypothetical protein
MAFSTGVIKTNTVIFELCGIVRKKLIKKKDEYTIYKI